MFTTAAPPQARLTALGALDGPGIVAPRAPLYDEQGVLVGFSMAFLDGWRPLVRLIPRTYRQREGLDHAAVGTLLLELAALVHRAHAAGATIVDLNPMNVLVSPTHDRLALIDVDSWAIADFGAAAIAPDVKDPCSQSFSAATDWYAFAVCAFQVLAGIHPYKGRHPRLGTVEARARAGISVFHPDVVVPPVVELQIPWRDWFEAVFSRGERCPPPATLDAVHVRRVTPIAHGQVQVRRHVALPSPIRGHVAWDGQSWLWSGDGLYQGRRRIGEAPVGVPVRTRTGLTFVEPPPHSVAHDGRILGVMGHSLVEHVPIGTSSALQPVVRGRIAPHATTLFRGVAITRQLGSTWARRLGEEGVHTERWEPLEGQQVLDAVHSSGVTVVIAEVAGQRHQHVFGPDGHRVRETQLHGAELVVLPTGVAAITTDDGIELFHARTPCGAVRTVDLHPPAPLLAIDGQLGWIEHDTAMVLSLAP